MKRVMLTGYKENKPHIIICQRLCSVYKTMGNLNFFPDQPQNLAPMALIFLGNRHNGVYFPAAGQ